MILLDLLSTTFTGLSGPLLATKTCSPGPVLTTKSGHGRATFHIEGPLLAVKSGPRGPVLVAKIGPGGPLFTRATFSMTGKITTIPRLISEHLLQN